ncbi:lipopolysaccharide biosynthesis protein [Bacteroides thetaiotaomicron]|nr:oligosaccharide flippase family protein [Bacteroides thetaiotaomicron]
MAQISNKFAIYITGGRLISMLAGFIMPILLVRVMSQKDYGLTSQFLTLYTAVYTISALGIHTNMFFFCPSSDKKISDKYVTNTIFLLILFGFMTGLILFIPFVKRIVFGDSELGKYSDYIILSISLATIMNIVSPLNTIREDKWGALIFPGAVALSRIIVILACALIIQNIYRMFFWLFVYQSVISLLILLYIKSKTHFSLDFHLMKEQLMYSLPFGFAVALQLLSNYYDKFVCIKFLSPTEYAVYAVAFFSIPGITQIYDSLCQVNIVNMSNSFRGGKIDEILPQYSNFVIKTLSFSTPIILIVSLYAEEIMSFLYTEQYISAAPYFRLYSLTFLTSMLGAGIILRSVNKTKLSLLAFVFTCIIGLPLTYLLVKHYNALGAICGAMINIMLPRLIQIGMEMLVLKSNISVFLPWKGIFKIAIPSLLLLVPFFVIKKFFHLNIWFCIIESLFYVLLLYYYFVANDLFVIRKHVITRFIKKIIKQI